MIENKFEVRLLSSLEKVFADEELTAAQWNKGSMLSNEVYAFQAAYHWNGSLLKKLEISVDSELNPWISLRTVGLVPCELPCYHDHDDIIIRTAPGLYPDTLIPLEGKELSLLPGQWRSIWITITPDGKAKPGIYPVEVEFKGGTDNVLGKAVFQLEIIDVCLPKQTLIHTEWFHADCIATIYDIDIFSEEHWTRMEQYVKTAVEHGMNMILTPIFTPPLDTAVNGERPTVQLVDVEKSGDKFRFGFDKLARWVDMCRAIGMEYFEISHLFTQWGAKNAPKIMASENGVLKRIFGWDTDAVGEDYKNFLRQFLPELIGFLKQKGIDKCTYFHVSDEPRMEHFEQYKKASCLLEENLQGFPVIDALSDYEFYRTGVVKNPIPANDHIDKFLENNVPGLWTYYCCVQDNEVSNRFFNMPSARNRIIGMQLYKHNISGFLHWGYNFWYSQYSKYPIDPFKVTDAGHAFPGGDAFLVYPGKEGPIESIRLEVFYEALQDLRALKLAETIAGRDAIINILEDGLDRPIDFRQYPTDPQWLLSVRERINRIIEAAFVFD